MRLHHQTSSRTIWFVLLLFCSCTGDISGANQPPPDDLSIRVTASVNGEQEAKARVTDDASLVSAFEAGDEIGVYVELRPLVRKCLHSRNTSSTAPLDPFETNATIGIFMKSEAVVSHAAENYRYRKAEGGPSTGFLPATSGQTLYYPIDGSTVVFCAYAPHNERTTGGVVPVDLSVQESLPLLDLLSADCVGGKSAGQPEVSFVFRHVLTKLHFDLKPGKGVTEEDLIHTLVEIRGVSTRASFFPAHGSLADRSAATDAIVAKTYAGQPIAEAILLPIEEAGGIGFLFTFKNQMLLYYVPAGQSFVAGAQYNYTVKINGPDELLPLEIECGISDWRNEDYEIEI